MARWFRATSKNNLVHVLRLVDKPRELRAACFLCLQTFKLFRFPQLKTLSLKRKMIVQFGLRKFQQELREPLHQ